jgi:hypothetical protein
MARSKVPTDPNMTPEVRRYLDDLSRASDTLQQELQAALDALPDFASQAEAEAGASTTVMMSPLRTNQAIKVLNPLYFHLHVRDEKTSGTDGGTFTSGAWQTRTLNTVVTNRITGASLASNTVTLPAGLYLCQGSAPAFDVGKHKLRLWNVDSSAEIMLGSSDVVPASGYNRNIIQGEFTLSVETDIRLEQRCQNTKTTNGFGVNASLGTEIYADISFWKLD